MGNLGSATACGSHIDWKTWKMGEHLPFREKLGILYIVQKSGNLSQFSLILIELYLLNRFYTC